MSYHWTEEQRANASAAAKNRSTAWREKMLGHPNWGPKHQTVETRALISAALMGPLNPNWGIPMRDECKERLRASHEGKPAWNKGIPCSDEQRADISVTLTGRVLSEEHRMHISAGGIGRIVSGVARAKISGAQMGPSNSNWKGGPRLAVRRQAAKRRGLRYVYLNEWFPGCDGHHVDNEQVIHMPHWMHQGKGLGHNLSSGKGMGAMNAIAYNFLFKQEVEAVLGGRHV